MKRTYHILRKTLFGVAGALLAVSCSESAMDRINENPNEPADVPAGYTLLQLAAATAINTVGADFPLYASVYMELEAGVHNQLYNAEKRNGEPTSSMTYNNSWGSTYINLTNAKDIIAKCREGGTAEGNTHLMGMAQVLEAINIATLTNLFGDVPYSQAAVFDKIGMPVYPNPVLDKQADIYQAVFQLLDEAETNFESASEGRTESFDLIYGGNTALWIKAVNALRARCKMQLLFRSTDVTGDLNEIVTLTEASFTNASEQMSFDHFDAGNNFNPLFCFMVSRNALGVSQSYVDKIDARSDPRSLYIYGGSVSSQGELIDWNEKPGIQAVPNGEPLESQSNYDISLATYAWTAPVHYISYHELMFIKAEALVRLGRMADAKAALKEAVTAAFLNLDVNNQSGASCLTAFGLKTVVSPLTAAEAEAYFAASVSATFDADPLKEVLFQKYMACEGANGEALVAYNDYRRMTALGEGDYITLANPLNDSQFPQRFTYGSDDVLNNTNVKAAYGDGRYAYSENVWWAGGTR
jgi:hypothetical protein